MHNPQLEPSPGTTGSDPASLHFKQKALVKKQRARNVHFLTQWCNLQASCRKTTETAYAFANHLKEKQLRGCPKKEKPGSFLLQFYTKAKKPTKCSSKDKQRRPTGGRTKQNRTKQTAYYCKHQKFRNESSITRCGGTCTWRDRQEDQKFKGVLRSTGLEAGQAGHHESMSQDKKNRKEKNK